MKTGGKKIMIIVTARMNIKTGQKELFIKETEDLVRATRQEKGCLSYDLFSHTTDEDVLLMLELWENMDSLNSHVKTEHFKKFKQSTKHLLEKEMEIKSYSVGAI